MILLASQMSFAIGTHYCGGMAVESRVMIGHDHMDCGMPDMDQDFEHSHETGANINNVPCCDNEYDSYSMDESFETIVVNDSISIPFLVAFATTILIPHFSVLAYSFNDYIPPLVITDMSILHQVFLI